ncbi:MAG: LemA family protein [Candidatus Peribacteraceae bacterium]|nr:LemA family protein [Candidatus Peribacteraceae bacterium]
MRKFSLWSIVLVIVIIAGLWLVAAYNGLVTSKGSVENAWAQVETQYQRRVDLVPNLVSTVKGAANFEQETFRAVTEARSAWAQAKTVGDRGQQIQAASSFDGALGRLLVTVEAYPQLQATQAFRDLMTQLEGTENRIAVARKDFNDSVFSYNVRVRRFPGMIAAKLFGYLPEQSFEASPGSDTAPAVDFTE